MAVTPARPFLEVDAWRDDRRVVHGFCGRAGGVSAAPYQGLNLSYRVGDAADTVAANWRNLAACLPQGLRFAHLEQVHGDTVRVATADRLDLGAGDAAVTCDASLVVGVLTADCVPILLRSRSRAAVAAIHAGWRGTVADIAGAAVRRLTQAFGVAPSDLEAAIGPAIGPCCYEVGEEVRRQFAAVSPALLDVAQVHQALDLRAANRFLLERAGLRPAAIFECGPCTRCAADRFFSHRAAQGGASGRQLSFIAIV